MAIYSEIVLCGVTENPGYCIKMLRRLTRPGMKPAAEGGKPNPLTNLAFAHHQAVLLFVRSYGDEFLMLEERNVEGVIAEPMRERCQGLVTEYFESLCCRLVKEHVALARRKLRNKEELMSRGSLSKRSSELLATHVDTLNRLLGVTQTFAELLNKDMPTLDEEEEAEETKENTGIALWDRRKEGDANQEETLEQFIYGGEENRAFYCDLLDLQAMVPGVLLGEVAPPQPPQTTTATASQNHQTDSKQSKGQEGGSSTVSKGTLDEALGQLGVRVTTATSSVAARENGKPSDSAALTEKKKVDSKPAPKVLERKKASYQKGKIDLYDYEEEYDYEDDQDYDFDAKPDKHAVPREVQELLATLPNCLSRAAVDKFAVEFCHLNSKQAKACLLRELRYIPWNRTELIPYYARVTATLSQIHEDIGPKLMRSLLGQFRFLVKSTSMNRLESRLRNARYVGELVKFNLENLGAPPEKAFYLLNTCYRNFAGSNINYVCELLETCGRYLYRNPETHVDTEKMLDVLWRYRKQLNFSHAVNTLIENAYFFSKAKEDESQPIKHKEKSNVQLYLEYLFFDYVGSEKALLEEHPALSQASEKERVKLRRKALWAQCDFVAKQVLGLSWNNNFDASAELLISILHKTYKLRSSSLPLVCRVVADVCNFYPKLPARIVDALIERIEIGLERNDYRYQQKRLGEARLFAELYNSRLVDNGTFFDVLFLIIHHGHSTQWPEHASFRPENKEEEAKHAEMMVLDRERRPRGPNFGGCRQDDAVSFDPTVPYENDPPDDTFRIRLVCEAINTCGVFVRFGTLAKRMDRFWAYLEQYAYTKTANILFTHHLLNDTLQNLKSIKSMKKVSQRQESKNASMVMQALSSRPRNFEEARLRVKDLEGQLSGSTEQQEDDDAEGDDQFGYVNENEEEDEDEDYENESEEEEDEDFNDDSDYDSDEEDFIDEDNYSETEFDAEAEAEAEKAFEKEFAQLMQSSQSHITPVPAKSSQNMAIPRHLIKKLDSQSEESSSINTAQPSVSAGQPQAGMNVNCSYCTTM